MRPAEVLLASRLGAHPSSTRALIHPQLVRSPGIHCQKYRKSSTHRPSIFAHASDVLHGLLRSSMFEVPCRGTGTAAGIQLAVWLRLAILQPLLPVIHSDSRPDANKGLRHVLALAILRLLCSPLIRTRPGPGLQPSGTS